MSFHDFSLAESEGPYSWEPWGIRKWYATDWWTDNGYRIRCRTNTFDSVEDARWSLNYSTALQRVWGQGGLLEHRQVFASISGDDPLAIEIEVAEGIRWVDGKLPLTSMWRNSLCFDGETSS